MVSDNPNPNPDLKVVDDHKDNGIRQDRAGAAQDLHSIHGHAHAVSALIGSAVGSPLGLPFATTDEILDTATLIIRANEEGTFKKASPVPLAYWEAGWTLVGALMLLGPAWSSPRLTKLFALWKMALSRKAIPLESPDAAAKELRARILTRIFCPRYLS